MKISGNKIKELYQEYDRYIVYKIYLLKGDKKIFLYTTTESKIKTKKDELREGLDEEDYTCGQA